jgi:hypothetical protein
MPTYIPTWQDQAQRHLQEELRQARVGYSELAIRMRQYGFDETEASIISKLVGKSFSESFYIAALNAVKSPYRTDMPLRQASGRHDLRPHQ